MNTTDASSTGFNDSLINPEQHMGASAIVEDDAHTATGVAVAYREQRDGARQESLTAGSFRNVAYLSSFKNKTTGSSSYSSSASPLDGNHDNDNEEDNGNAGSNNGAPKKRTKTGCLSCRRRKVKCDEEKPFCRRCQNARIECAGYPVLTEKPPKKQRNSSNRGSSKPPSAISSRRSSTAMSASLSSESMTSSSHSSSRHSDGAGTHATNSRPASPPSVGPVRKAARLSTMNEETRSDTVSMSVSNMRGSDYSPVSPSFAATASPSSGPARKSRPASILLKRKSLSNASLSSLGTAGSAPVFSGSYSSHSPASPHSNETIATAPTLSRVNSTGFVSSSAHGSTIHTPSVEHSSNSSSAFERDFNSSTHRYQYPVESRYNPSASSLQMAFSPTLAPPLQPQVQHTNMPINGNTFAPFAFDSPFPMQPFASASPMSFNHHQQQQQHQHQHQSGSHHLNTNLNIHNTGPMVQANTPIDFDSLFGYSGNNMQQADAGMSSSRNQVGQSRPGDNDGLVGAPFPVDYWEDTDFVDRIMTGFKEVRANEAMQGSNPQLPGTTREDSHAPTAVHTSSRPQEMNALTSAVPSISSGKSTLVSPTAMTPSPASPVYNAASTQDAHMQSSHSQADSLNESPRSAHSDARSKGRPMSSCSQVSAPTTVSTSAPANTTMADFAPQPAIDPILQATSTSELHKAAANRNKNAPSLKELEMGPPPNLHGNQKEWSIPPEINETMKGMTNARHVELLKHYFINLVGLFSPIDHPKNPFRTFVAEHATESLSLLHAVLAVSAINQQPLSVEARAESLLYFEAAVDLYVRSLQQQDDISLFTLLFLSLYYAFDSGTAQPQHFSRRAQSIINERFELLGCDILQASSDFRFLVRLHVWYEVMANISRRAGDLRDMACGQYTLTYLISIIEQWDAQEEKAAGLSGVNPDYVMTGCVGVPTFFISLLNDIMRLKEEQHSIMQIPIENLDEAGQAVRKAVISKHSRKIRDLECKIQFARPGRLLLPPVVANELQIHRAVSVRFFDLFRLAASIHLLTELQGTPVNDPAIQLRTTEMVNLLGNIEQNSNYNTSGIWAFFIAGAAASNHMDRIALHRRLDSTWNSPCGNVWSLRSVLDEVWQRNAEALEDNEPCQTWKGIAQQRGWLLLLM